MLVYLYFYKKILIQAHTFITMHKYALKPLCLDQGLSPLSKAIRKSSALYKQG